ncbi:F-box only protein 44 isoform X3 [Bubalus bubalis]|uniref:F-box only protein 44 isoform X3 n=1 Tax=Bubalus bubalis TaxID=89462 RepID=UPI001E1B70FA|nr:F-box only protein 44 isoform X3 [Bubalus bubalis]
MLPKRQGPERAAGAGPGPGRGFVGRGGGAAPTATAGPGRLSPGGQAGSHSGGREQLLLRCRLVCSLWRDLIDLVTLWKRKCLREGFITEDWDQPVADWKVFYFLRSLRRNLLHNPCAEEGFEFWSLDVNGGDEWKVEDLSKDQRKEFPNDQVCSQARLRVQVPAVCSAPVVSTRTSGDLPARPSNDPAEERCQVEGGLPHFLQLSTWRPLYLVSARRRGHSLLGRLVRPKGHQQQHHHRAPTAMTPPSPQPPNPN